MNKPNPWALLPIGIFLIIFLGSGFLTGDFYSMPAVVGFLIALLFSMLQNRTDSFEEKLKILASGVGDTNIITMCLIFLTAGGFSGAVTAAGGMDSTVNLGLSILPSSVAVVGLLIIASFISLSMGTSMGTIAALAPIAIGISEKTGHPMGICIGAVMCGAMFGDNLSMISDTTIAAVRTQGCNMKDKFKENFWIVLPAALATIVLYAALTGHGSFQNPDSLSYSIWKVLPYLVVLIGALAGFNVFAVLITGTILSLVVGVASGAIAASSIFTVVGNGITSMYDITIISVVVACIVSMVKHSGGIAFLLSLIKSRIKGEKGGELGIAVLALFVDMATANNTIAIVIAGPIAKEIAQEYKISPKRSSSLLDIFASVGQGLIPYGAQLLSAATLTGLTPYEILPFMYYPVFMMLSALGFIFFRNRKNRL